MAGHVGAAVHHSINGTPQIHTQVTTVYVKGGYEFSLTSDNHNVDFTGVRFEITDGAEFNLNLAVGDFVSTATFTGVTGQVWIQLSFQRHETQWSRRT